MAWNRSLAVDAAVLKAWLKCDATFQTWTDAAGANEDRPITCLDWYEAFAFCIWDGGRLPTEAEWNYAAAGGSEQRQYPWSVPPASMAIDDSYAVYCGGSCRSTQDVGSKSAKGDGRWGQADLAGNVWEWNFDWYASAYTNPCVDCAGGPAAGYRVIRGGSFANGAAIQLSAPRYSTGPWERRHIGARCARTP